MLKSLVVVCCIAVAGLRAHEAYSGQVEVQTLLKTSVDAAGHAIVYPTKGTAQVTGMVVEVPVGQNTGWHLHPVPCVAYVLNGDIDVEDATGVRRHYHAGSCFAELINTRHCGYNVGSTPVKLIFFAMGVAGKPISTKSVRPEALSREVP